MPTYDHAALAFLGLSTVKGVGFQTLRDLGGVAGVDQLMASLGAEALIRRFSKEPLLGDVENEIGEAGYRLVEQLEAASVHLIRRDEPLYPSSFLALPEELQPLWFFYKGDCSLLSRASVTVVGTRKPSEAGAFLARYAVLALCDENLPTVSGLAIGIDEIVHDWSLTSGLPTISVLGTGLLRTYPASNANLSQRIVDSGGLLISEYLPHAEPTAQGFVWRNRLQAALGRCLVAPEWKANSGTAHTVRYARSLDKPTINLLVQNGPQLTPGRADFDFTIPKEHDRFVDCVVRSVKEPETMREPQLGFGFGS